MSNEEHIGWREDCSSGLHEYCNECKCPCHGFNITKDECKALYKFLANQFVSSEDVYLHRLINGLGRFLDDNPL